MELLEKSKKRLFLTAVVCLLSLATCLSARAASDNSTTLQGYGIKIFKVESALYPFVQVYLRTFDQKMDPLINLNERNIGIMVAGRSYDIGKRQYAVQSIRHREEMIRSILVLDTSKTMLGAPFNSALTAATRFISNKRPQDQVAIVALADNVDGYEMVSNFERNSRTLIQRLSDVHAIGKTTHLYDAIAYAMQLGAGVGAGGTNIHDADYAASTSIVVFSDGKDEGSAVTRSDLMTRITNLPIPIPIYSLAYTKIDPVHLKNLRALSKNSFGKYYHIEKAYKTMTRSVEDIQNILQSDYVVAFRAYLPVDGEEHRLKIGIEYPSNSGQIRYQTSTFEALAPPPMPKILQVQKTFNQYFPALPDSNPYMNNEYADKIPAAKTAVPK